MKENKLLLALALATSLTACSDDGDADENVVRNIFAVGDIVEGVEDGDPVEGDVSRNDLGDDLTFALAAGSEAQNGVLEFNPDGSFIYTPNPEFFGTDSVTYVATQSTTGDTDTAMLTVNIENDFEYLEEYGWQVLWSDDFTEETLDESVWEGVNTSVVDGALVITAVEGMPSSLKTVESLSSGRIEASIQVPDGADLMSIFGLKPMADIYEGNNSLTALEANSGGIIAAAHYGLGHINGVNFNSDAIAAAKSEFHLYAIEWHEEQIRWYIDGVHVHTVNPLNTWAYTMNGEEVVADQSGPFNQPMQIFLELEASGAEPTAAMLVDYVKVWSCDSSVTSSVDHCASYTKSSINKAASDRIESVGNVTFDIFADGYFDNDNNKISDLNPLTWHYTDEIIELSITNFNEPMIAMLDTENDHNMIIDVSHPEGDANIGFSAPGVELIGKDAVIRFDMYIDSANTFTETVDIRMETGWPYMGMFTWNVADLELDTWVTYTIPVSDFVNNPFLAPDWLTWIPGVAAGDPLPLDTSNVGSFLIIEFHGGVHFQLDNIQLSCVSSESCIQGPLAVQAASKPEAPNTLYEAENWLAAGDVATEDTADEGGGQNVGWIDAGDFLEYSITAPSDGLYYMDYRLASSGGSDGFEMSIDGSVVDIQSVSDTGGWQNWQTQSSAEFELSAGEHNVRFDFLGGAVNFNWFKVFEPVFEIFIEAEAWEDAGDVATEDTIDDGGGQNVGWIDAGDFLQYTVNIPADGTYNIIYRVASSGGSDGFETSLGGTIIDTQTVSDTGGWQNWTSQTASVDLVAGEQTLRLDFVGGAINFNWIKITN